MPEMFKVPELPRVKRRPKPLRELDQTARRARLRLEEQIFRPRLVRLGLRVTTDQLQRVDAERRIPDSRGVPSRCAMIRSLIDEGLAWRSTMRPKTSGPMKPARPKRAPFPISLD
jgi:hypothetical protein